MALLGSIIGLALCGSVTASVDHVGCVTIAGSPGPLAQVRLAIHGPEWSYIGQEQAVRLRVTPASAEGTIPMPQRAAGNMRFSESLKSQDGRVVLQYAVTFTEESSLNGAYVVVTLPTEIWKGREALLAPTMERRRIPAAETDPRFAQPASAVAIEEGAGLYFVIASPSRPMVALE
ncbi:MAG: hypothetical protein H5T86_05570, partial [Armatimonadetes bacterium]|nr:hypothetical protein [Armatimonadota bacterium]